MNRIFNLNFYISFLYSLASLAIIIYAMLTIENYEFNNSKVVAKSLGYIFLIYLLIQPIIIFRKKKSYSLVELKSEGGKAIVINILIYTIINFGTITLGTYSIFNTNNGTYMNADFTKLVWSFILMIELILANYFPILKFKTKIGIHNDHTILDEKIWRTVHLHASKVYTFVNVLSIIAIWYFDKEIVTIIVIFIAILKRPYLSNYSEKMARKIYLKNHN